MTGFVSFDEVKAAVPIEKAVQLLQLTMKQSGPNQLRGPCPACKSGERTFAVNVAKASWYCFAAKAGGDVISMTAHIRGVSQKDAAHWLLGTHNPQPRQAEPSSHSSPSPRQGMEPLAYLEHDHPAVEAVGFDAELAKALGIGFAGKGLMRGLVAVPIRLETGELVGYIGITEARLPNQWHLEQKVVPLHPKKTA